MVIEVVPVAEEDKAALGNLVQLYLYDLSEVRGVDVTPHGTFVYRFLDHYFTEGDREACFITVDGALAGFSMTRRLHDGVREMSEFFVLRRHRRQGAGQTAAQQVFQRHPGDWTLAFDQANHAAARFWPRAVSAVVEGTVYSQDRHPPDVTYPRTWLRFRV